MQLNHIHTLTRMIASVRKPYLNLDARNPPLSRQGSRTIDIGGSDQQSWANIKHLTNEERDQIDLQARVILSRCSERIKEMEVLEKRKSLIALMILLVCLEQVLPASQAAPNLLRVERIH